MSALNRHHKTFTMSCPRLLGLIMLAFALCVCAPEVPTAGTAGSAVVLPSPSPTPQTSSKEKRPNAVRRFFSWTGGQLARPFRKEPPFVCGLMVVVNSISTSKSLITFCPTTTASSNLVCSPEREVKLSANATAPDGAAPFQFTWTVTGGSLRGEGRDVTWDLSGLSIGSYTATVEVNDGNQHTATGSTTVTIALCPGCEAPVPLCPDVSVSCPDNLASNSITFEAVVKGGDPAMKPSYTWSISAGQIISGQGTSKLTVDTSERGGRSITATVLLGGVDPACTFPRASCTLSH